MKKFDAPCMTMVYLSKENVIITSGCNSNYCDGYTCDDCGPLDCPVQTPCKQYNCPHVLCPTYMV